ncbi:MAG TPA: sigma-54 dependent transcriptional regulator, partial [Candidatus Polarisedimenticolia bacterium]|nr:sigma-54 dependent transcriptional regulator [Candidatus Polarisedimenticolia bacterium]
MDRILIVDDEPGMRDFLSILLRKEGYGVTAADGAERAMELAARGEFDLVISDIAMPGLSGIDVLRQAKSASPDIPVILITAYASTESAVEALKLGAYDYLIKPFDVEELKTVVRHALEKRHLETENRILKRELKEKARIDDLVGESPRMKEVFDLIDQIAPTHSTVLICGESGTGKELAARAIHARSPRKDRPFVSINCGAMPDELLESELFGHARGSFTGAVTAKKGLFEVADGGTLFLDEIGDTTPAMQVKLLRVLQERRIRRVGGTDESEVNVRVLAATNQDLEALVREKRFREDLFYRINVILVRMPALREKREDVPRLVGHFVEKYGAIMGKRVSGVSDLALRQLQEHDWPGNVRELENVIERAVALARGDVIGPAELSNHFGGSRRAPRDLPADLGEQGIDLERQLEGLREQFMQMALDRAQGVQTRAAELLGMSFRSFRYFAKKYQLIEGRREPRAGAA